MKIEAGKFYADGEGRKVGPIRKNIHSPVFVWRSDNPIRTFTEEGKLYMGHSCKSDLVSEWIEPSDDKAQVKALAESETPRLAPEDFPDFAGGDMVSPSRTPLPKVTWANAGSVERSNAILDEMLKPKTHTAFAALAAGIDAEAEKRLARALYADTAPTIGLMAGVDVAKPGSDRTAYVVNGRALTWADLGPTNYEELADVLQEAFRQASEGKGEERHANGKAFGDQPIMVIPAMLGSIEGQIYQVIKKAQEANSMAKRGEDDAAKRELYGVINYAAAAIMSLD